MGRSIRRCREISSLEEHKGRFLTPGKGYITLIERAQILKMSRIERVNMSKRSYEVERKSGMFGYAGPGRYFIRQPVHAYAHVLISTYCLV